MTRAIRPNASRTRWATVENQSRRSCRRFDPHAAALPIPARAGVWNAVAAVLGKLYRTSFVPPAPLFLAEAVERRLLLSGYTLSTISLPTDFPNGEYPEATLVSDSSGDLFGTTERSGPSGYGTVFEIGQGSSSITTLASFNVTNGAYPESVTLDGAGDLFGTTEEGGPDSVGTVFEIGQGSNSITTLASFNSTNGAYPYAGVTLDGSGDLFGTTNEGGAGGDGTVFEISHGSSSITTLASFNSTNGAYPEVGVTRDSSGDLFGTTDLGGATGYGTVFEIAHASSSITTLVSFNSTNVASPSGVTLDGSGDLFGTTYGGSTDGTVFEIGHGSSSITTLASFNSTNGAYPYSGVTLDSSGDLLGTTEDGGANGEGTVFEIGHGTRSITTLASFNSTTGGDPYAGVTLDSSGDLFGATEGGGGGGGTVFEIGHGSSSITTLANFNFANEGNPYAGVTLDGSGDLFGTTEAAGAGGYGTVFEIGHGSSSITILASFNSANGATPYAGMTLDGSGDLFGTTEGGGAGGDGTVFEIGQGSRSITTLATFYSANGAPYAGVTLDSSGDLFGTTEGGGASSDGTVFEIGHDSSSITTLASFNSTNGAGTFAGVTLDGSGDLFGTTANGSANGEGTVFEIGHGSSSITTLASFGGTNGLLPFAGVTLDGSGDLFGTTGLGGAGGGKGTVFEIAHGSRSITTLASFNSTDGAQPDAGVTLDGAGDLFGTTFEGGASNDGTVFEIGHGSSSITTLANFNATNGANPHAGVTLDSSGNLFGTTLNGGAGGDGTVFELTPPAPTITVSDAGGTFSGSAFPAAATVNGAASLEGVTPTLAYHAGTAATGTPLGGAPSGAGTYTAQASFAGSSDYAAASSGAVTFTIAQATPIVTVSDAGGTYNGSAFAATEMVNGSAGLEGVTPTISYYAGSAATGTPLSGAPTAAGTYTVQASFAGSSDYAPAASSPATFVISVAPVTVTSVVVNGNNPALAGAQRSMVTGIEYTFSTAVELSGTNAFTIAVHAGQTGTLPTLAWTAIDPAGDGSSTQWAVTFSGTANGGPSIDDGVYDVTLNTAAVTSDANPSAPVAPRATDTFYRLFGDVTGAERVSNADYNQFLNTYNLKSTQTGYNAAFDATGTNANISNADYNLFLNNYNKKLGGFSPTI